MLVAGVDIGAATAKAAIVKDNEMISFTIMPTGADVVKVAKKVLNDAAEKKGLSPKEIDYTVATGYGRISVPFADKAITEISCHARGAHWFIPETKMIIDIGGQDSKAIAVNDKGEVADFVMNDKCAAGTGRFFEVMATVLELSLEEFGLLSLKSKNPCKISSICTIFAESEVISLRAEKKLSEDIIAGLHRSAAKRIVSMASQTGFYNPIVFTGGVAKNIGMRKALEEELQHQMLIPDEPQIAGALGAALFAQEMVMQKKK